MQQRCLRNFLTNQPVNFQSIFIFLGQKRSLKSKILLTILKIIFTIFTILTMYFLLLFFFRSERYLGYEIHGLDNSKFWRYRTPRLYKSLERLIPWRLDLQQSQNLQNFRLYFSCITQAIQYFEVLSSKFSFLVSP